MKDYLTIDPEIYFRAYNDPQIIYHYSVFGYNNLEYLSWANAYTGLKQYHPSLIPQIEDELFKVDNQVEDVDLLKQLRNKLIEERLVVEEKLNVKFDKELQKLQKQLDNKILDIENQLVYSTRGYYLKIYLVCTETGKQTPPMLFPIMDTANNSCLNPDTRDITDNMQRGFVKAIGLYTGYGFRLFTRENIGKSLADSDIVKKIKYLHTLPKYKENKTEYDKVIHLGQDIDVLTKVFEELKSK